MHDGQAKAEAPATLSRSVIELMILLEDNPKRLFGDANSGVPDFDAQHASVPAAAYQLLSTFGVFQRVRNQIADHLLQQPGIAANRQAALDDSEGKPLRLRVIDELVPQLIQQMG